MYITDWIVLFILCIGVAASIGFRKLTIAGSIAGGVLGWLLYKGVGTSGIVMLAVFFVAGTLATSIGRNKKERLGIAEKNKGQRTVWQVLANGGIAGLAGLLAWIDPHHSPVWPLAATCALSSASADTLSSELGSLYGKRFYNILNFQKDQRGLDGVVSVEGTLLGLAGSALIAGIYSLGYGISRYVLWILIAGTIGNLADSLLGAALERKGRITNDWVNGLNTLVAATVGVLLWWLF